MNKYVYKKKKKKEVVRDIGGTVKPWFSAPAP
jgi:hypothetical protein